MISIKKFRDNIYHVFNVLAGTGLPLEIIHKGKVYQLTARLTDIKPLYPRAKRPLKRKPDVAYMINYGDCPTCGFLTVNENCLNMSCASLEQTPKRLFNYKHPTPEVREKVQANGFGNLLPPIKKQPEKYYASPAVAQPQQTQNSKPQ